MVHKTKPGEKEIKDDNDPTEHSTSATEDPEAKKNGFEEKPSYDNTTEQINEEDVNLNDSDDEETKVVNLNSVLVSESDGKFKNTERKENNKEEKKDTD